MAEPSSMRSRLRDRTGRAYRVLLGLAQRADPSRLALRPARPGTRTGAACVYRCRNVARVQALLRGLPAGTSTALWCLDAPTPDDVPAALAGLTVGHGPGTRFALLDRLVATLPGDLDALVLLDDDVRFAVGDLDRLIGLGLALGLDLFQPAHLASSWASWAFTRRRAGVVARTTSFVEQGPVLVLSRRGQQLVLPLPQDVGMGWGVEARWSADSARAGARLGIVDAAAVLHLDPPAAGYTRAEAEEQLAAELARAGLRSLEQLHVTHETGRWPDGASARH